MAGIWTFEEARRVEKQDPVPEVWRDHGDEQRDYDWLIYCRGTPELELDPPFSEDFTGSFPFHNSKLTGTGIEMDDVGKEAYVEALLDHGVSATTANRLRESLESSVPDSGRTADYEPPERTEYVTSRPIRDTKKAAMTKALYDYHCQVCSSRRECRDGSPYAEGHHIKPLGKPHRGPDTADNILCLCPNHHADFDYGRVRIDPETFELSHAFDDEADGSTLEVTSNHTPDPDFLRYHNEQIAGY